MTRSAQDHPELDVAALLSTKRQMAGLSRRELGRRCGLSVAYVSALETGRIRPSLWAFGRLAVQLRMSAPEVMLTITAESARLPRPNGTVTPPGETDHYETLRQPNADLDGVPEEGRLSVQPQPP